MLLIRKRTFFCVFSAICCVICLFLFFCSRNESGILSVFAAETATPPTVIIDPGHGGEDGGAVSVDGVQESRINLEIALRCHDLFRLCGQRSLLTRSEDVSIHTEGDTIQGRKASDIRNRTALVNAAEHAVLLSIHQNSLPSSPVTRGAQVFWNRIEGAELLAKLLQDTLNNCINPERPKQARQIDPTIYLPNHVTVPAVLIECGFLTNETETAMLQQPQHQKILAAAITAGCLRALSAEEKS